MHTGTVAGWHMSIMFHPNRAQSIMFICITLSWLLVLTIYFNLPRNPDCFDHRSCKILFVWCGKPVSRKSLNLWTCGPWLCNFMKRYFVTKIKTLLGNVITINMINERLSIKSLSSFLYSCMLVLYNFPLYWHFQKMVAVSTNLFKI